MWFCPSSLSKVWEVLLEAIDCQKNNSPLEVEKDLLNLSSTQLPNHDYSFQLAFEVQNWNRQLYRTLI